MNTILLFIIFLNIFLGIFVLTQDIHSRNNKVFFLLCFLASIWSFTNYMTNAFPTILWFETSYSLGALVITTGLIWTFLITNGKLNTVKVFFTYLIALFFSVIPFKQNFISKNYEHLNSQVFSFYDIDWGLKFYFIFYIIISLLIIFRLYFYYISLNPSDTKKRNQVACILGGALTTISISAISSFVCPSFSIFISTGMDSIGFLFFLILVAFAITKYQLFNIRIFTIQLIFFGLLTFLLIRTISSRTLHETLWEGGLFVLTLILSVLFVQIALQNTRQRKEIENLTEDLQKTYSFLREK